MNKVIAAILVIFILIGLTFIAVPFDGNPLYETLTHLEIKYSAQPTYSSPLADCDYNITCKAYKDYKSKLFTTIQKQDTIHITNRTTARHKLLEFIKKYVNDFNFTLHFNVTIITNDTGVLVYQKIIDINDLSDKEIHIYTNTTVLRPCTYVRVIVSMHLEFDYTFFNVTSEHYHFSKTIVKERVIHIKMSPTASAEYQLYSKT